MSHDLRALLIRHEGLALFPYRCPAGKLTIGVGRNLEDTGISESEALALLDHDIARCSRAIRARWPWVVDHPPVVGVVLVDMAFNLGIAGLAGFQRTLAALQARNYALAADEMLRSRWAGQVGARAVELAKLIAHADKEEPSCGSSSSTPSSPG